MINGVRLGFRGTDDAHLEQDHYVSVAGPVDRTECDAAIGVTHSPYRRVLDAMTSDGHDLIMAGHTHGGQVCVPGYGALVTNCDLDRGRAKGLSRYSRRDGSRGCTCPPGWAPHPYAPIRFACPPEATLLTLIRRALAIRAAPRRPWARLCRGSRPRGVAQLGSALRSGRRGRRFKSCHPDHRRPGQICWTPDRSH